MPRERDEIWDELVGLFGPVRTKAERGRRNVAVKQLREAGATPLEVAIAFDWCLKNFTVFTEMALVSHFSRAQHESAHQNESTSPFIAVRRMADGE